MRVSPPWRGSLDHGLHALDEGFKGAHGFGVPGVFALLASLSGAVHDPEANPDETGLQDPDPGVGPDGGLLVIQGCVLKGDGSLLKAGGRQPQDTP